MEVFRRRRSGEVARMRTREDGGRSRAANVSYRIRGFFLMEV